MSFCMHIAGVTCDNCRQTTQVHFAPVQQPRLIQGQKCDLCGSTAIDHTEVQCQLNRMRFRANTATSQRTSPVTPITPTEQDNE